MRLTVLPEFILIAPLVLGLFAMAPWLAPVRAAFLPGHRPLDLAPAEVVIACIRPDKGVLACFGLLAAVLLLGLVALLRLAWPIDGAFFLLAIVPLFGAVLAVLILETRHSWILTDRRLASSTGAVWFLQDVDRISIGPGIVCLDGTGRRHMRLIGVPRARDIAQLIKASLPALRQ
ncbi:MAG: hypothetical protein KJZ59_09965 [Pararhodobacter sp.]|nr:hypothetical protein [Pararhodobacter sp.]